MSKKKCKSSKRNKFIAIELNLILTQINKFPDYSFITGNQEKVIFLTNGEMRKNVSNMAFQLSLSLKINKQGSTNESLDIEKTHHYMEKCIKYQENKFNQQAMFLSTSDYSQIETMINRELIGAKYKVIHSSKGAIITDHRPIYIEIKQNTLYGYLKSDRLDQALIKLIHLTQNQCEYDLKLHMKRIVSDEYGSNKYQEFIDSESYKNLKSMIDEFKRTTTPEMISFFEVHQSILNRYGLQINIPLFQTEQSDMIMIKRDLFHISFQVGSLLTVNYCVLKPEPDTVCDQKSFDNYGNILNFIRERKQLFNLFYHFETLIRQYYEFCELKLNDAGISIDEIVDIKAYSDVPSLMPFIKGEYFVYQWKNDKRKIGFDDLVAMREYLINQITSDFSEVKCQFVLQLSDYLDERHQRINESTMKTVFEIVRDFPKLKKEIYIYVLRGSRRSEIIAKGYHLHSSYGALKHCKGEEVEKKIDELVKCGQVKERIYRSNRTTYVGYSIK